MKKQKITNLNAISGGGVKDRLKMFEAQAATAKEAQNTLNAQFGKLNANKQSYKSHVFTNKLHSEQQTPYEWANMRRIGAKYGDASALMPEGISANNGYMDELTGELKKRGGAIW